MFIAGLDETFERSKEEFAKHFHAKYERPPPVWIAAGTWDWGKLSHAINHLSDTNRDAVCRTIHPDVTRRTLVSWMRCLNEVRNACAHHSRLWNRAIFNSPRLHSEEIPAFEHLAGRNRSVSDEQKKRLYGALITTCFLIRTFHPNTEWPRRLAQLVAEAHLPEEVGIASAGFPVTWRDDPMWS